MKTHLICALIASTLVQCNRSSTESPTTGDAAQAAAPSVDLIANGLSPHFLKVASRLEVGGNSFSYLETGSASGSLRALVEQLMEAMPAEEKSKWPSGFSPAKVFDVIGMDSVQAVGSSSRTRKDGRNHSRAYAYAPAGRTGLLALTGGEAEPMLITRHAPPDTDLALEFPLRLKDWFAAAWPTLIELIPDAERGSFEQQAIEKIPAVNLSAKELAEQLDLRLALFASLRPEQELALPGAPVALPGLDAALVIERLGPLASALKEQLAVLPPMMFESNEQDGVLTVRMGQPMMPPPMDFQIILQLHLTEARLILATRPAYLEAVIADSEGLMANPASAAAWDGMPEQANGVFYLSKRFMETLSKGAKEAFTNGATTGADAATQKTVLNLIDTVGRDLMSDHVFVYANEKDGIYAASNSSLAGTQIGGLSAITAVAVVASLAVPTFNKIQSRADDMKLSNSIRQAGIALKVYASDYNGSYPKDLSSLLDEKILEDDSVLYYLDPDTGRRLPWLYDSSLTDSSDPNAILLASPVPLKHTAAGKKRRLVLQNDLSISVLEEETFNRLRKGTLQ